MRVSPLDADATALRSPPVVCHLTSVHGLGDARVYYRECRPLAARGFDVILVATGEPAAGQDSTRKEQPKLVSFPRAANRWRRLLVSQTMIATALRQGACVYHVHDPELIPTALLLKLLGKRVVYDTHEDFPSMMMLKRWLPVALRSPFARLVALGEKLAARTLDAVVTADPAVLARFRRVGSRGMVLYNFPLPSVFGAEPPADRERGFDIVYLGGMSERAGTFVLLLALDWLAARGLRPRVRLVGYFDDAESEARVRAAASASALGDRVVVEGRVAHSDVPSVLSSARIGVVPLQPVPKFMKNIPTKLFEYWACGLPVVASDLPPSRPFFRDGELGFLVQPDDPAAFGRALETLLRDPERRRRMGEAARREVLSRYNAEHEADKLAALYHRILGQLSGTPPARTVAWS